MERLRRIGGCTGNEYVERLHEALGCEFDREHPMRSTSAVTERLVSLIGG